MQASNPFYWSNIAMAGITTTLCVVLVGVVVSLGVNMYLGEYVKSLREWRKARQDLEAERIIGFAKNPADSWVTEMEAKTRAHQVRKPAPPWPFGKD